MTRKEAERQTIQSDTLQSLGFTAGEAESLRRISMTLRRWYELECGTDGGCIERDETTNKAYWLSAMSGRRSPIADRETGAVKRLKGIIDARNTREQCIYCNTCDEAIPHFAGPHTGHDVERLRLVSFYLQTDPRGASLYIIRPGDVPDGADVASYYGRGIVVY